jgi:hypothetical protein
VWSWPREDSGGGERKQAGGALLTNEILIPHKATELAAAVHGVPLLEYEHAVVVVLGTVARCERQRRTRCTARECHAWVDNARHEVGKLEEEVDVSGEGAAEGGEHPGHVLCTG